MLAWTGVVLWHDRLVCNVKSKFLRASHACNLRPDTGTLTAICVPEELLVSRWRRNRQVPETVDRSSAISLNFRHQDLYTIETTKVLIIISVTDVYFSGPLPGNPYSPQRAVFERRLDQDLPFPLDAKYTCRQYGLRWKWPSKSSTNGHNPGRRRPS